MKQKKSRLAEVLPERQMSEAFINSFFLALSGGFQDAYTYNCRDEVFSNAQTGNVVLMSQHFMEGRWQEGLRYLLPLLSFAMGVILALVGFIPRTYNMTATILVSFACAMQVQSFRKVGGYSYASTMCIGNLRSGMAALSFYVREHRREQLRQMGYYFGVIGTFAVGAGIGGICSHLYGIHVIWISCLLLLVSFIVMSLEKLK